MRLNFLGVLEISIKMFLSLIIEKSPLGFEEMTNVYYSASTTLTFIIKERKQVLE